ncbi:adenosine deaminase [Flavihumibacter rivuli]|uniref:adenosine deaminase n=1 Tax=Flavihumibacter rivuli TaxID=2838156 RepID=UPI001BDE1358|nr:adenosine deaminase [Flavihumibacter rivuli]ULQ56592.1 adenosine deaminase [Flavihumibacter rivuli]
MEYASLPKVELHVHLDCCLSFEVAKLLSPSLTYEVYRESFVAPPKCCDLADYITRAVNGFELMQSREALRLVTLDLFRQWKQENVVYAEMRFAPLQHIYGGLQPEEVVQAVVDATEEGIALTGIEAGILLCTLRHYREEQSMQTVQLVERFRGTRVYGFDIAADEAGFPIAEHISAFGYAREHGIPCTAHAGEARGADSVWETLKHFHPKRIGHGVRSVEDPSLLDWLRSHDIHLEVCPTSNVQTNVCGSIAAHPIDRIYRQGVSLSVNTDARTISNCSLSSEYTLVEKVFGWGIEEFYHCNREAIRHAFAPETIKAKVMKALMVGFGKE